MKKANEILSALKKNSVMHDEDLENLAYLLLTPSEELKYWYASITADEMDYAKTLLQIAQDYFSDDAYQIDTTQAKQLLQKYML